ncbi:type II restriction endonuclease [Macrococcus armenti]|uniref:type II restriction endonuclease n=1 Tax=Macrococcus armenti TaxID=2875764 RepID=UPI001CD014EF|nr:type II restriction endonuclease [Macrococcus armenti]UBH15786.1 restriction endonuclease [Macrococcus armenti]UBH18145.1 restriction endonuclease [Macrococcus armenti]UBH20412.1 restriction endonuclease [Macrococcus armenti]
MERNTDSIIKKINSYLPNNDTEWELVGFINKRKEIFAFGNDSKIIGRLFEVIVYDALKKTADDLGYELFESDQQTVYPDFYFVKNNGRKIAIDIKTTYRRSEKTRYGFTAGSFTSFMRNGTKNIVGNYSDYDGHYILGIVYNREISPTKGMKDITEINSIVPAYKDIEYFIQEKFRICGEKKGSGNTDNIGTIKANSIDPFIYGAGPFAFLGEDVFFDYWKNYPRNTETKEVKKTLFNDIPSYIKWVFRKDEEKARLLERKYEEYLEFYNEKEQGKWKESAD